jgi:hypothetical protein
VSDESKLVIPDPEYVIRGNRVKCLYCGLKLKTSYAYSNHFMKRHMNEDGTWREATHNFDPITEVDPAEQEAIDHDQGRGRRKKHDVDIFGIRRDLLDS